MPIYVDFSDIDFPGEEASHTGGVHVLMGDGSVRFLTDSIGGTSFAEDGFDFARPAPDAAAAVGGLSDVLGLDLEIGATGATRFDPYKNFKFQVLMDADPHDGSHPADGCEMPFDLA